MVYKISQYSNAVCPVILLVTDIQLKVLFHFLIDSFSLSISLGDNKLKRGFIRFLANYRALSKGLCNDLKLELRLQLRQRLERG